MRNTYFGLLVGGLLASGCMMTGHDCDSCSEGHHGNGWADYRGTGGRATDSGGSMNSGGSTAGAAGDVSSSGGEGGSAVACAADGECPSGYYCAAEGKTCLASAICELETDCAPGFNCDPVRSTCAPATEETCSELATEQACVERQDCEPVYAGVDCSCGAECACIGGEPGCVCQRFEFFGCVASE